MKKCSRCKLKKPVSAYANSRQANDGKNHRCNECNRQNSKDRYEKLYGTKEQRQERQDKVFEFIKGLRESGYTLRQIAEASGLDESTISYYLSGKRKVGMQAVKKWEAVL